MFYPRTAAAQWAIGNTAQRPAPIPYIVGGNIVHRPSGMNRIPPRPVPPTVLDRNGCVAVEGLE